MSRLVITALSEDFLAAPRNRKPNYIVLSVTDSDGSPISGLQSADFAVKTIVAPGGGKVSQLLRSAETDFPGVYLIEVIPERNSSWKKGVYIFAIGVHRNFDRGQSLASVFMD